MSPAKYIATAFATALTVAIVWCALAWSEIGTFTNSSYAQCLYLARKEKLASAVPAPRLVVIGGSNATMGVNMGQIARQFGVRAFNYGLVIWYGPDYELYLLRKALQPGDAVLLQLEYFDYDYNTPTNGLIDTVYACGSDYWRSLSWADRLAYALYLSPAHIVDTMGFDPKKVDLYAEDVTLINELGDLDPSLLPPQSAEDAQTVSHMEALQIGFDPNSAGARSIADFIGWAHSHGVTVFATWPNTIRFPEYGQNPAFEKIRQFYRERGVAVIGAPGDAMFAAGDFYNSNYHLKPPIIVRRTALLGRQLAADPAFMAWVRRSPPP